MNVHVSYKTEKSPDLEQEIGHHIEKLQRRLQVFRPELVHLHGIIEKNSAREGVSISLNLRLPSGQLAAQEAGPTALAAVKSAFHELVRQLNRHKELLRGYRQRARKGNGKVSVPFEQTLAAVHAPIVSESDITTYVNANVQRLQRFIERELRYRVNNGQLRPNLISTEEVLDEAIANALGDEEEKPEVLSLERWLYRLAISAINSLAEHNRSEGEAVPLEQSARRQNVLGSDEPQLQFHQ